ncbi:hypothetical protein R6Q59_025621 [Mikania micrantha]
MEQIQHFSHSHLLTLVQLHPHHNINANSETEDEDHVVENRHVGKCEMCKEEIYSFNLCYYSCEDCDYLLRKFCAQLPTTQQSHQLHPGHILILSQDFQHQDPGFKFFSTANSVWKCCVCKLYRINFYNYHCSICKFDMDIICATMSEQKMDHPSHPHQLQRYFSRLTSLCHACGKEHSGTFYHCTTCSWFRIHLDCGLLPTKLLIQQSTKGSFSHPHLLMLTFSFPYSEKRDKFFPHCKVCDNGFNTYEWHYRCNKCRYYIHVYCTTSKGLGKTHKKIKVKDQSSLIRCPFPDESSNLLKHLFINKGKMTIEGKIDDEMFSHPHPLILFDTPLNESISLHDPMKRVELLCDGCVRPIVDVPFYKCSQHHCDFVLHEWCTRLPFEIQHHHDHQKHTLLLLPKIPGKFLNLFKCAICGLHSNGFVYGCMQCEYYMDINCGFIPLAITHEAHFDHPLLRYKASHTCKCYMTRNRLGYHCFGCDFSLHIECALLLPKTIKNKFDKHPLSLRYDPAEDYSSDYFCEICEDELNLKLECEQSTVSRLNNPVSFFSNVKFGETHEIIDHPHPLTFVQGINADGECKVCHQQLRYSMILKCFMCKFACHRSCVSKNSTINDA